MVKKLLLIILILGSSSLLAETVSIKKAECSFFGNMKVKVSGLESYGWLGKTTLAANIPMGDDCDRVLSNFLGSVSRSSSRVSTDLDTRIIYTQTNSRDDKRDEKKTRCRITEKKTLSVRFLAASSFIFKSMRTKDIGNYRGTCNRR
jgi:hypothetical protein